MSRMLVLLSLIGSLMAQETFFKKYGFTKAMTTCFGQDVYFDLLKLLSRYADECQREPVFIKGMSSTIHIPVQTLLQPGYYADAGGQSVYLPVQSYYPSYHYGVPSVHRYTRQVRDEPFFDRDLLQASIGKIQAALSNFTCILKKDGSIDDNLTIQTDSLVSRYYATPIHNELREDLIQGIQYCSELVSCLPLHRLKSPVPEALQRLVLFAKCERKLRLGACFKHDIRRNINEFDLSALPDLGGRAGDVGKLMAILIGAESLDELELI